ncbi:MAG: hypothetical protein LBP61_00735 [Desulfovibrio sp.]|jgi:hypothetical protein|nr:hypothetical protein [Desulfovibrio sp.]
MRFRIDHLFLMLFVLSGLVAPGEKGFAATPGERRHFVFLRGSPQELDVYKIRGRAPGPTVMIIGGIQGDEPGGFLSADLYADLALKRGNLIVVPRANFRSVIQFQRAPAGDMNRKFAEQRAGDPENAVVNILKELMAESDVLLNLHDGSGFYRPRWESDLANPKRYGQCVIVDSDIYTHQPSGRRIDLEGYAAEAVRRVNREIDDPLHKFHVFNMYTVRDDTRYMEQRGSATYYALTRLGIPAFGIETSKNLPTLELKVRQHNLAVNAFLDLFGVEVEYPRIVLDKPVLGYVVIAVNAALTLAVADGQTLLLTPGDSIEVLDVGANYDRGLSVEILGTGGLNDILRPVTPTGPTDIVVRKDNVIFGRVHVDFLPEDSGGAPLLAGGGKVRSPRITHVVPPGVLTVAETVSPDGPAGRGGPSSVQPGRENPLPAKEKSASLPDRRAAAEEIPVGGTGGVRAFLLEVDGRPLRLLPGEQAPVPLGARVRLVDVQGDGAPLPAGVVMNLRGFVSSGNAARNTGEDRGATADTAKDMRPAFSEGGRGEVYAVNAEQGKTILASCSLKLVRPVLESVTVRVKGQTRVLRRGSRTHIAAGAGVEVLSASLAGGLSLQAPRFTLGGRPFPADLPQTVTMRSIALNLAVFEGNVLTGKVTWVPW